MIRLRFMPVISRLFDHLPAVLRWGWLVETLTLPPEPIYVPPRKIAEEPAQRARGD